jgi:hypothetical protein
MLVDTVCFLVSITGVSASTSTVVAMPATASDTFNGTMEPAPTGTLSLVYSLKPDSRAITVYRPGARFRNRASPRSLVTAVVSWGPVSSTVTPGNTAPVPSATVTSMRPVKTCANAGTDVTASTKAIKAILTSRCFILPPCLCGGRPSPARQDRYRV